MSKTAVLCIAKTFPQAERIVERLQSAGFANSEISIVYPEGASHHETAHLEDTKAPEGIATGATTGGVAGGVLGLLVGVGALAIPGVGPFIAAGPIIAVLSGAAVGATTGGLLGGLIGLGIPEVEAKIYESKIHEGNYLIAVHARTSEEERIAADIYQTEETESIFTSVQEKEAEPTSV